MPSSIVRLRANEMRRAPTRAELMLYNALLVAFEPFEAQVRSQEPIGYYIADFMIYPARLVVEVDGKYHDQAKAKGYDRRRDSAMQSLGIRVLRIRNERVFESLSAVVSEVIATVGPLPPRRQSKAVEVQHCPPAYAGGGRKKRRNMNKLLAFNAKFPRRAN